MKGTYVIIENGFSSAQLGELEMNAIYGGEQPCGIQLCGADVCGLDCCIVDLCPLDACLLDVFVTKTSVKGS